MFGVELFEAVAPFLNAGQEFLSARQGALPQAPDSLAFPSQEAAPPQVPDQQKPFLSGRGHPSSRTGSRFDKICYQKPTSYT